MPRRASLRAPSLLMEESVPSRSPCVPGILDSPSPPGPPPFLDGSRCSHLFSPHHLTKQGVLPRQRPFHRTAGTGSLGITVFLLLLESGGGGLTGRVCWRVSTPCLQQPPEPHPAALLVSPPPAPWGEGTDSRLLKLPGCSLAAQCVTQYLVQSRRSVNHR